MLDTKNCIQFLLRIIICSMAQVWFLPPLFFFYEMEQGDCLRTERLTFWRGWFLVHRVRSKILMVHKLSLSTKSHNLTYSIRSQ